MDVREVLRAMAQWEEHLVVIHVIRPMVSSSQIMEAGGSLAAESRDDDDDDDDDDDG